MVADRVLSEIARALAHCGRRFEPFASSFDAIEVWNFLKAIADDRRPDPDFEAALDFERVIHAIDRSAASKRLVSRDRAPVDVV